jgi:hypothetical protein
MPRSTDDTRTDTDILDSMEQVLGDAGTTGHSRRALMTRAGGLLAAGAALSFPSVAGAQERTDVADVLATFETFGVTILTEAVRRAPGTPSAQFAGVVQAANTTEFVHLQALNAVGAKALTQRFWIPNAVFDGGPELFGAIAAQEEIEISAYLVGVTKATQRRNAKEARLYAEALGTEAEHRVLARFARATLLGTATRDIPNNRGFEAFDHKSALAALNASTRNGIGYGEQTPAAGAFYEFPGDPRTNGTGINVYTTAPS